MLVFSKYIQGVPNLPEVPKLPKLTLHKKAARAIKCQAAFDSFDSVLYVHTIIYICQ